MKTPFAVIIVLIYGISAEDSKELPNVLAFVGRPFIYPLPRKTGDIKTYKVHEDGKESLPEWLSYNSQTNLLLGVPTVRDRQLYQIVIEGRTTLTFTLQVQDLVSAEVKHNSNVTKLPIPDIPSCHNDRPLAVATIVFDLNIKNLSGQKRVDLMKKVSLFADVALEHLHMCRGKGHNTAIGLKDVMMLTAGPGTVKDASEQGVALSWQIGCGIDIAGTRVASLLKSSTATGAFYRALDAPISGWHITTGFPKEPKKRVRRQLAIQPTPIPFNTVAAVLPSSVCARCVNNLKATATPTATIAIPATRVEATTVLIKPTPAVPTTTKAVVIDTTTRPPTTTETETTTKMTTPSSTPSSTEPSSIEPKTREPSSREPSTKPVFGLNKAPKLLNHIDRLSVFAGHGYRHRISHDNFYDKEDGDTRNLKLELQTINGDKLLPSSWILLNQTKQEIYALPMDGNVREHEFMLFARDSGNLKSEKDAFIFVVKADGALYNHQFSIHLDVASATFLGNVGTRLLLLDKLTDYFHVNFTSIRVVSYVADAAGVLFTFQFDFIPYESCQDERLVELRNLFAIKEPRSDNWEITSDFRGALMPEFPVISGEYKILGDCAAVLPPGAAPVGSRGPGVWWTYGIIPAIVIAAVLLIIGVCVLIMMKCRRGKKLAAGDKKTYIYKKKPVVFREEFEIKEECLKMPLILPNEKPPLPPPAYTRTPNGSAVTTPLIGGERRMMNGGMMAETSFSSGGGGAVLSGGSMAVGGGIGGGGSSGGGDTGIVEGGMEGGSANGDVIAGGGGRGGGHDGMGGGGHGGMGAGGHGGMGGGGHGGMGGGGYGGMGGGGHGGMGGGGMGVASGGSSGGGTAYQASSFSTGSRRQMSSSSFTSSHSAGGGSTRKVAYSGYRLPPAYVPP